MKKLSLSFQLLVAFLSMISCQIHLKSVYRTVPCDDSTKEMTTVWAVTIQWTGLLDWNTGLDDWTDTFLCKFLNKPIHIIKIIMYTPHLIATVCQEQNYSQNYDSSDSNDECEQNSIHS